MTLSIRARSSKAPEDHSFRPAVGRVEGIEVGLLDHQAEGFVKTVTSFVLFNADDVHASIDQVAFDDVRCDGEIDSADVRLNREIGAGPRHHSAARLFTDDKILISGEIRFHP